MHGNMMKYSVPPPMPRSTAEDVEVCGSAPLLAVFPPEDRVKILAKVISNTQVTMLAKDG